MSKSQLPATDLFIWIIDLLATRYGWSLRDICDLYWEELWEMVLTAANNNEFEKNQEYKFQFMLHTENPDNWEDSPLPFPDKNAKEKDIDLGGISQLPSHLMSAVKRRPKEDNKLKQ